MDTKRIWRLTVNWGMDEDTNEFYTEAEARVAYSDSIRIAKNTEHEYHIEIELVEVLDQFTVKPNLSEV